MANRTRLNNEAQIAEIVKAFCASKLTESWIAKISKDQRTQVAELMGIEELFIAKSEQVEQFSEAAEGFMHKIISNLGGIIISDYEEDELDLLLTILASASPTEWETLLAPNYTGIFSIKEGIVKLMNAINNQETANPEETPEFAGLHNPALREATISTSETKKIAWNTTIIEHEDGTATVTTIRTGYKAPKTWTTDFKSYEEATERAEKFHSTIGTGAKAPKRTAKVEASETGDNDRYEDDGESQA